MAQIFDRSSNALARMSLVLTGLIVIALGVTLDQLQRSPWVTRQGQRAGPAGAVQPQASRAGPGAAVPVLSHVGGEVELRRHSADQTCMNCHAQIWTNAQLLEPVRQSWATGESIPWIKVHDLPDFVYFNHEIHVNKGIGCASCHGRVDQMPLMYEQNTLQMEWCLDCHRNPAKNLRPTSEIYNMAWESPADDRPVWCAAVPRSAGRADGAERELHDAGSEPGAGAGRRDGVAAAARGSAKGLAGDVAAAAVPLRRCRLSEVHQPGRAGPFPGGALQDSHAEGADQLRGVPPMSETVRTRRAVEKPMGNEVSNAKQNASKTLAAETANSAPMTLEAVRQELKGAKGKKFWRSLDELANTPEFQAAVEREFPSAAQEWVDPVSRRGFLKLMGASMALAGLAGCTKQPDEPIYPYVKAPEDLILGKPMYFATAHPFATGAVPLLVKSDEFRPIKVDGNPEHPYNQGGSDPYSQGTLLDLYDPDRSQHVTFEGEAGSGRSLPRRCAERWPRRRTARASTS